MITGQLLFAEADPGAGELRPSGALGSSRFEGEFESDFAADLTRALEIAGPELGSRARFDSPEHSLGIAESGHKEAIEGVPHSPAELPAAAAGSATYASVDVARESDRATPAPAIHFVPARTSAGPSPDSAAVAVSPAPRVSDLPIAPRATVGSPEQTYRHAFEPVDVAPSIRAHVQERDPVVASSKPAPGTYSTVRGRALIAADRLFSPTRRSGPIVASALPMEPPHGPGTDASRVLERGAAAGDADAPSPRAPSAAPGPSRRPALVDSSVSSSNPKGNSEAAAHIEPAVSPASTARELPREGLTATGEASFQAPIIIMNADRSN